MTTMADTTTTATGLLADSKMLGRQALGAIKVAIDTTFGKTETAVPKLVGDAATWAGDFLDRNAHGSSAAYLKGVLGIIETTAEPVLDRLTVTGLVDVQAIVDNRIDTFHPAS